MSSFEKESDFEEALVELLSHKGWEKEVLMYPTEADLLRNWADILFQNNNSLTRLNDCPLIESEMRQIIEQIRILKTPLKLNSFINGRTISIRRENPLDTANLGKNISLKIFDRQEIAAGQSRYQIARQPLFVRKDDVLRDRRGDLMLLINGMPVFHLELKRSGVDVSQACNQIKKYSHEGVFSDLFSLVQIFVAMTPEETLYFANPGADGRFNEDYFFHWADFNNEPINNWKDIAGSLISIPMAHQMLGFYTVADDADGVLKVMRSYQYYAAHAISDTVSKHHWGMGKQLGGYIWHTTGSGKTMTSFKSAQLIAASKDADKVVFLMDRIELGTQSLKEYRSFADASQDVQETEDTQVLVSKLKSSDPADTLIVTSIQKMGRIRDEQAVKADIKKIQEKRIVFIVDEAHRSTFGDYLIHIKQTFKEALFFGFTGTPIFEENMRADCTMPDVFGNELHRYCIANGIEDGNVLGFDPYMVCTFRDNDLREAVALEKAKAATLEEVFNDPEKKAIYMRYMDASKVPMASDKDAEGKMRKGIEDYVGSKQYRTPEHREAVIEHLLQNWPRLSHCGKFHAIFATATITEAIEYYRLIKEKAPQRKISAVFEPSIDDDGDKAIDKQDGIVEMIVDYNERYGRNYALDSYALFKKDVAKRLAHKAPHTGIERKPEEQLDLLIVVNQMLTGFDSKWVNTLYLDKLLRYEMIIQAFSRTNRLFGHEKPFGSIFYYRMPHTMQRNVDAAIKLYSGDKPLGVFAVRLKDNLEKLNETARQIKSLFKNENAETLEKLPDDEASRKKFASLFREFDKYLQAAKIQGFNWEQEEYEFESSVVADIKLEGGELKKESLKLDIDEETYLVLALRYKELFEEGGGGKDEPGVAYAIASHLTEIDTGRINADYLNSRFERYLRELNNHDLTIEQKDELLNALHSSFATLSREEQKYADIFLHDVARGEAKLEEGKSFRDYVAQYMSQAHRDRVSLMAENFKLDEAKLRELIALNVDDANIDEFNRFTDLKQTADISHAQAYLQGLHHKAISARQAYAHMDEILRKFIISGGNTMPN